MKDFSSLLYWFALYPQGFHVIVCKPGDGSIFDRTLCQHGTCTHSHMSAVYCSVLYDKQTDTIPRKNTQTHTFLCWSFFEKRLKFPHSHFHRAPYLTLGKERNKQRRAASGSLSDLKFIKYIKPGRAPSGNIGNPKLCLLFTSIKLSQTLHLICKAVHKNGGV